MQLVSSNYLAGEKAGRLYAVCLLSMLKASLSRSTILPSKPVLMLFF